jgi:hypothetical protein
MKVLKESDSYLKRKAVQNLTIMALCIIVFAILTLSDIPHSPLYIDVGRYEGPRALLLFFPFFFAFYFFRKYSGYKQGYEGENRVSKILSSALSDEYYLINDVMVSDGYGNIDHVVLGPNGVFVIETKNYSGKIACQGDEWTRQYTSKKTGSFSRFINFELGSPSKQARRNSMRIKRVIESSRTLKSRRIWVEGIVVFANQNADLNINNPTLPILKIGELPSFIVTRKSNIQFTLQEIELMGKEILRQTLGH